MPLKNIFDQAALTSLRGQSSLLGKRVRIDSLSEGDLEEIEQDDDSKEIVD